MSGTSNGVEWVETTEEVVVTEECLPPESNTSAGWTEAPHSTPSVLYCFIYVYFNILFVVIPVIPVLEPAETPIQKLLDTVGHGDGSEAEGFCKEETLIVFLVLCKSCRITHVIQTA